MARVTDAQTDPNSSDYALSPMADPGHTHTSASITGPINGSQNTYSSPVFVSTTARTVSATNDSILYIAITTSASLTIAMGPDNTTANNIMPAQSAALGVVTLRVPAGHYVKLTGTMADLQITALTI